MSDYISRDVAIIEFMDNDLDHIQASNGKEAVQILSDIPAADVVPVVHGKWIDHGGNKVKLNEHGETCGTCFCNQCGEWLVASDEYAVKGYFCPNCGAKMDGGKNT